jgi:hypothetical protein
VAAQKVPLYSLDEVALLPSFQVMKRGWKVRLCYYVFCFSHFLFFFPSRRLCGAA